MKRFLLLMMVASVLVIPAGAASAASEGCDSIDGVGFFTANWGRIEQRFARGEAITVEAADPSLNSPTSFGLRVNGADVLVDSFPGTLTFTVPSDGDYRIAGFADGPVTWTLSCTEPVDSDGDGVLDIDDLCDDTVADGIAEDDLKTRHYAWYEGAYFVSGGNNDPVFSIADTGGCSGKQIIDALGLGQGHLRNGLSLSALRTWVDSVPT